MEDRHSGSTISVWMATQPVPAYEPLRENVQADVCIVGAGISGLTTAYFLALEKKRVVVINDGPILSGETERTTAHLASALDDRFVRLEKLFGEEGARLAADSHASAINQIETVIAREGIACDFERLDGYLFLPPGESEDTLREELAAAHRAGLTGAELVARAPVQSFDTGLALRFPNQGQFHPTKYLSGLAARITQAGGKIFSHTRAVEIAGGTHARVKTAAGQMISAGAVVVATNAPVNDRVVMHTKQSHYRTYAIGARLPAGVVTRALYWDTLDPYHYVRVQPDNGGLPKPASEILIVGGEDHKTGQKSDGQERFARLEAWTRERFPIQTVEYRWSGQVVEPVDGLAYIGRNPADEDNVFIVTGDSGQGMTHGTIAGMLINDLICGRQNRWQALYDPARKNLGSVGEFARENLNVALQYTDYVRGGDVSEVEQIQRNTGAIIRSGLRKLAVYRDSADQIHQCSAVCTHLGCIVAWNPVEKSWDCPCHGSRFDPYGKAISGPATHDLEATEPV